MKEKGDYRNQKSDDVPREGISIQQKELKERLRDDSGAKRYLETVCQGIYEKELKGLLDLFPSFEDRIIDACSLDEEGKMSTSPKEEPALKRFFEVGSELQELIGQFPLRHEGKIIIEIAGDIYLEIDRQIGGGAGG